MTKKVKEFIKREAFFIAFFSFVILFFFWKLIFLKESFLHGDYKLQLFPWSMQYAESIKHFKLPLWTPYFHCGFPLFAEGQVAALYPLNIILFFLLPPLMAYTYSFVLHFIIAGIFMYIYARSLGLKNLAAIMPVFLFLFGSFYAGLFYNITALRTLVWFPLVLFLVNKSFEKKKRSLFFLMGIIIGIQLLGGSVQLALYSIGMYFLYLIFLITESVRIKEGFKWAIKAFFLFIATLVIAFAISGPQLMATRILTDLSNRSIADINFALWGSFLPAGIITAIFPYLGSLFGGTIYIGIIPLFFAIISMFNIKNRNIKFFIVLLLVSFLLALGKYNPLYVLFLKITHLYAFRNPAKFLFFSGFSLAVLAGFGLDYIISNTATDKMKGRINGLLMWVSSLALLSYISMSLILRFAKGWVISFGRWYVSKFIYGTAHHRYSLEYYMDKVESFYQSSLSALRLNNPYFITAICLLFSGTAIIILWNKNRLNRKLFKYFLAILVFVDIWIFSFYGIGFRGNIKPIDMVYKRSKIVDFLKKDKSLYRVYAYKQKEIDEDIWSLPNFNMFYHIFDIGAYSPLVMKRYHDLLKDFGCVDDSLGVIPPRENILNEKLNILSMLNVKYIISPEELKNASLEKVFESDNVKVYLNKLAMPRAYFTKAGGKVEIIKYSNNEVILKTTKSEDGALVLADIFYPGWRAFVDDKEVKIYKANLVTRAVYLPKGIHKVEFLYSTF